MDFTVGHLERGVLIYARHFFFDKKSESKSDTRNVIFDHTDQIGGLKYIDTSPLDAKKYGRKKPLFSKLCIILWGGGSHHH